MLKTFDYGTMPIVEIVNEILLDSSKRGASDIHFDPQAEILKVRIRIDGALHDYCEVPNNVKKNLTTRVKIIAGMNITESRLPQDGAIKTTIQDVNLDLRVSVLPVSNGEKIVIRILDYTKSLSGLDQLDFSEDNYKKLLYMIGVPNGIILVTGATGSGKSTTVYSVLQRLNKEDANLITVEDPIEMDIEGINQVQVNSEIGLTFAAALRSILRQDPNVIMIGEIRDTETAKIAVRASITGHLVLSTIHTNNSLNTIERLVDMDVERYLLSSALTGIISQKLARKLCPHCKKLRPVNDYETRLFKKVIKQDVTQVYSAVGCEHCNNGYSGRIAIHEVLLMTQEIRDALSSGMSKEELRKLVYGSGVQSLLQDGLAKVVQGHSTVEEILKLIELENEDSLSDDDELKKILEFSTEEAKQQEEERKQKAREAKEKAENTAQQTEQPAEQAATTETQTVPVAVPVSESTPAVETVPVAVPVSEPTPAVETVPVAVPVSEPTPAVQTVPVAVPVTEPAPAVQTVPVAVPVATPITDVPVIPQANAAPQGIADMISKATSDTPLY